MDELEEGVNWIGPADNPDRDNLTDAQLPAEVERGAESIPRFNTKKLVTSGGHIKRNRAWDNPLHRFRISYGANEELTARIKAFFMNRAAGFQGFLFKDWTDYTIKEQIVEPRDDGTYQIYKDYGAYRRDINMIVDGSVSVQVGERTTASARLATPADPTLPNAAALGGVMQHGLSYAMAIVPIPDDMHIPTAEELSALHGGAVIANYSVGNDNTLYLDNAGTSTAVESNGTYIFTANEAGPAPNNDVVLVEKQVYIEYTANGANQNYIDSAFNSAPLLGGGDSSNLPIITDIVQTSLETTTTGPNPVEDGGHYNFTADESGSASNGDEVSITKTLTYSYTQDGTAMSSSIMSRETGQLSGGTDSVLGDNFTVDLTTGVLTITGGVELPANTNLRISCEFMVPVLFDIDEASLTAIMSTNTGAVTSVGSLELTELRLRT